MGSTVSAQAHRALAIFLLTCVAGGLLTACRTATESALPSANPSHPSPLSDANPPGPKPVQKNLSAPVAAVTLAPLATATLTSSPTALIPISATENLGQEAQLIHGPWELVLDLAWAPDGDTLAVAAGMHIYLYASSDWQPVASLSLHSWPSRLAFHPSGNWLAVAERDGRVEIWSLDGYRLELSIEAHRKGTNQVRFSPDGAWLASSGNDGFARVWSFPGGSLSSELIGGAYAVPDLAFTSDSSQIALANADLIRFREISSQRITYTIYATTGLYSLAFSPEGARIAAGSTNNRILIWDLSDFYGGGKEIRQPEIEIAGHNGADERPAALVWALSFSPNGQLLASAGGDQTVGLWNSATGALIKQLKGYQAAVTSVAFSPEGEFLATGSLDGWVIIWGAVQ